ncbi:MAG: nuclease-related domain-containing protein [Clostridium sp.]|uniref:nuclease-related domain-containing protein n=1 Tax=Clostridium sp. TaxID=1506 RepID=UPI002904D64F|nr:nuclease-related domain-containing protein [Clostridium sp.]MDU1978399.1 nuclease-related domain-containing protein [Clostridium sp.]MDU1994803.1 nuclease-related domain-containing protein [Clostridium sp.]MDU6048462.1 nuclease-related domain-containing protein [Clostridium sp.]MDU6222518.1 nuclease-related domain-containing protein [Clostridium sp.]MDU6272584.1 nuclease-related domain-containing protein [Clostridium sp.]
MAKIIKKNNHLQEELKRCLWYRRISRIIGIPSLLLILPTMGITFIPFLIALVVYNINDKKVRVLSSGLEGENKANSIFEKLSDDYYVLSDLNVKVGNKTSQIDNIVVGSNGIFVIETKNLNGLIEGNEDDKEVVHHKVGIKGGKYSKTIYNPIKQVSTHVYRVSEVLKGYNLNKWVQGAVYFTNRNCIVDINSTRIPVFSEAEEGDKEVLNYIVNYDRSNASITQEDKIKIVRILKEFCIGGNMESNKKMKSKISDVIFNNYSNTNDDNLRMQKEMFDREFMEFSIKSVTPFDHGGFIQGEGFNPSDTMASEMFNMNNNF